MSIAGIAQSHRWYFGDVCFRVESALPLPVKLAYAVRHRLAGEERHGVDLRVTAGALPVEEIPTGTPLRLERATPVDGAVSDVAYWLRSAEGGIVGDLGQQTATLYAPSAEWLADGVVLRTLVPLALSFHLARHGLFYAHAAVVENPNGEALAILGSGGSGKSTAAYALVRRGWRFIADDGVLLQQRDGQVEALAFLDEFHLDRALTAVFPELEFIRQEHTHPTKGVVDMDRLFGEQRRHRACPGRILWLAQDDQQPVAGRAAFLQPLIADNPFVFVHRSEQHLATLTALVAQSLSGKLPVRSLPLVDPETSIAAVLAKP